MVVDSALRNRLHVIINMHHHDSLLANPDKYKARFLSQWKQISTFFKNYPDSLLFEILNEPNGKITPEKWNTFSKEALSKIREDNPERAVLIGTAEWGGLGGLPYLEIPNDNNIILTVHYYNPFTFTHQGASWAGGEANTWLGTKWLDTDIERAVVNQEFAPLYQFGKLKNIPVHIGEFGAYSTADIKSRAKWTTYIARHCESLGWSWAYWEFSAGFGIYDPVKKTYNAPLIEALILNKLTEPATYTASLVYISNFQTSNDGWVINNQGSAKSSLYRANNTLKASIDDGSSESWHVQLNKSNIKLESGKKYRLSFKAKAETSRSISAYLGMNASPWSAYSGYNSVSLSDTFMIYSIVFDMKSTDNAARMTFDLGKSGC